MPALKYIGVGVTEAGLVHGAQVMADLADFLHAAFLAIPGILRAAQLERPVQQSGLMAHTLLVDNDLSIINTDNCLSNGDLIKRCGLGLTEGAFSSVDT